MYSINKSYEIMKTIKRLKESMHTLMQEHLKELKLTGPQGMLVGIVSKYKQINISDLSEKMGLSKSTVSAILDRLEKQQVIVRNRCENDGRVVYVSLTEPFKVESKDTFERMESFWVSIINEAAEDDLTKILEGLSLLENLFKGVKNNEKID